MKEVNRGAKASCIFEVKIKGSIGRGPVERQQSAHFLAKKPCWICLKASHRRKNPYQKLQDAALEAKGGQSAGSQLPDQMENHAKLAVG